MALKRWERSVVRSKLPNGDVGRLSVNGRTVRVAAMRGYRSDTTTGIMYVWNNEKRKTIQPLLTCETGFVAFYEKRNGW